MVMILWTDNKQQVTVAWILALLRIPGIFHFLTMIVVVQQQWWIWNGNQWTITTPHQRMAVARVLPKINVQILWMVCRMKRQWRQRLLLVQSSSNNGMMTLLLVVVITVQQQQQLLTILRVRWQQQLLLLLITQPQWLVRLVIIIRVQKTRIMPPLSIFMVLPSTARNSTLFKNTIPCFCVMHVWKHSAGNIIGNLNWNEHNNHTTCTSTNMFNVTT